MSTTPTRSVLISGASIAGPALAHWLHRYGFAVTVVEKSPAVRGGGYPIDIRGTALDVVDRMGLLPRLRAARVNSRRITFLDRDGGEVATMTPEVLTGNSGEHDLEIRRGDLTQALYDTVRDHVEFQFGDAIAELADGPDGVQVRFAGGRRERYDLVIGADGLHSGTRALVFGPEQRFHRYLGYCFAGFTVANDFGLSHEAVMWNEPGRSATLYAVGDAQLHGFLSFARPDPPFDAFRDPRAQRALVTAEFAGAGWEVPRLVAAMNGAEDLFFDVVSQIRMPRWSSGRVALVGDAAYGPSFLTGQGTSTALVGAYLLARELAADPDHERAFAGYERAARPFVEQNQDLVGEGKAALFPVTAAELAERDAMLRELATQSTPRPRPEYSSLRLPDTADV